MVVDLKEYVESVQLFSSTRPSTIIFEIAGAIGAMTIVQLALTSLFEFVDRKENRELSVAEPPDGEDT
jgi:hypothetical protein